MDSLNNFLDIVKEKPAWLQGVHIAPDIRKTFDFNLFSVEVTIGKKNIDGFVKKMIIYHLKAKHRDIVGNESLFNLVRRFRGFEGYEKEIFRNFEFPICIQGNIHKKIFHEFERFVDNEVEFYKQLNNIK